MGPLVSVVQKGKRGPWSVLAGGRSVWSGWDVLTARSVAASMCVYLRETGYLEAHADYVVERYVTG